MAGNISDTNPSRLGGGVPGFQPKLLGGGANSKSGSGVLHFLTKLENTLILTVVILGQ